MAGTITGRNAVVKLCAHSGGTLHTAMDALMHDHETFGIGDFTLTFDRGTIEQPLIGKPGNYFDQGALSVEGSLTAAKFATSGISDMLHNLLYNHDTWNKYEYLAISGCVSTKTELSYLSWYLASCQVTGFDIAIGDASTITTASVDFTIMNSQDVSCDSSGFITG